MREQQWLFKLGTITQYPVCEQTPFLSDYNTLRNPGRGTRKRGIPNEIMKDNNHAIRIDVQVLSPPEEAVREYESHGGHLTVFREFGQDPLQGREDLIQQREREFKQRYTDFGCFFHSVANGNNTMFRHGLLYFIDISVRLSSH